ncbi:DNA-directed RNA polymerase omega subunit [Caldibacillus thermoamylovorans]|uniref:DNA-directed RNA polymerase subunit omega n=1 Tax=Caldibacillus thermoamylovorans TaxID=35841 RepID=UPI0005A4909B|nr:DNA-directed RNA polymerase subunit omega [Caldibacillus thermoamylovorans]KIO61898.1 DNA-directed RNA polymerase omega subunit [Caldibacillus thermoamylovorans]
MLYPSIDSLLEKVNSKYLLVTIASKRARQMQELNDYQLDHYVSQKNVGKALEEINDGVLMKDAE